MVLNRFGVHTSKGTSSLCTLTILPLWYTSETAISLLLSPSMPSLFVVIVSRSSCNSITEGDPEVWSSLPLPPECWLAGCSATVKCWVSHSGLTAWQANTLPTVLHPRLRLWHLLENLFSEKSWSCWHKLFVAGFPCDVPYKIKDVIGSYTPKRGKG